MPGFLPDAQIDDERLGTALSAPPSTALSIDQALGAGQLTPLAADLANGVLAGSSPRLTPQQANDQYGVPGYLTFEKPVDQARAAVDQHAAQRRAFREQVLSRSDLGPLSRIGSSLVGAVLDPVALPLIFAPELTGARALFEASTAGRAIEGASLFAKAGKLGSAGKGAIYGGLEGLGGTVPYEAANYGLRRYSGEDDYTLGDSLQNLLLGGVLGAGGGALLGGLFGHARAPGPIEELGEDARHGAAAIAIDNAIADRPVDVAGLVDREHQANRAGAESLRALDEAGAAPTIPATPLEESVAVTTRGTEIPVRYALVEMSDLVTSHDNDLQRNPAFPEALQPRDRTRAGSQAGNHRLEVELNPKRLMRDSGAETGAPLIAPDGTVESGNGRVIALRRSAETNMDAYGKYYAELHAQGLGDAAKDMNQPVLVRIRTQAMSGEQRAGLTREMNAAPTEALGPAEQAMADVAHVDDALLAHIDGTPQGLRSFARGFLAKAAPDQMNAMADAAGALSAQGSARIRGALVARAYDDPRLVEAVFEAADPNIRTIGAALVDAAPAWAKLRSLAARGEIPAELDLTRQLRAAVDMIRHARDNRIPVDEWIAEQLGQVDMFSGAAVEPETEAFLRLIFRDESFKRQRGADSIGWALKDYARQASETTPGANLFGETADGDGKIILQGLAERFTRDEPFPAAGDLDGIAPEDLPGTVGLDLRPDASPGPGAEVQPAGGEGAARPGGAPGPGDVATPKRDPLEFVDPELKALAETELADEAGKINPKDDPAVIAEAIRAAAFCLSEGI